MVNRRDFLLASAAALAAPALVRAKASRVLRFIPQFDLAVLDPHWSGTYVTRNHAYAVFDTLFGVDGNQHPSPQMVEGALVEDDGRRWTLTLRDGLRWHDGEPVLARDCVASIRRWAQRDRFGQTLMAATDEVSAPDDRTILFRLKAPFPLLPNALGKVPTLMPAMMPERLARTDAFTKVKEMVGSGPYRYRADEHVPGARVVYERFADYKPREGGEPEWTAGPKVAHFDRVEWTIIPEVATAAAALQKGEQDWWEVAAFDVLPLLRRDPRVTTTMLDPSGLYMILRLNHLHPPFDNPSIRRALLGAMDQAALVTLMVGDDSTLSRAGVGFFCPSSPMASTAGMEKMTGPRDLDRARRDVMAADYKGERVVALAAGDNSESLRRIEVIVDTMRRVGFAAEVDVSDFGTMMQRLFKKDPIERGGWNCATYSEAGIAVWDPAVNSALRSNGANASFGWPNSPRIEELRDAWLVAPDRRTQQKIAAQMEIQAFEDVPYIPLGLTYIHTAYRTDLTDMLKGVAVFWNVRRKE
jgi:peptide/nickel transport system substrate-binding protein